MIPHDHHRSKSSKKTCQHSLQILFLSVGNVSLHHSEEIRTPMHDTCQCSQVSESLVKTEVIQKYYEGLLKFILCTGMWFQWNGAEKEILYVFYLKLDK